ncbi:MAG: hypothetical protein CMP59_00880 [Flavobacteriales bacterium]|nr:hypothetical protein [Flavobacteriales bacterium]
MDTILLKAKSKENLNLLIKLAKKLGVEVSVLSEKATEEIAMVAAIKEGKTGKLSDTDNFIKGLKSDFAS